MALRGYVASTFGMISSFSRLGSLSVFETGTSWNGGQMSSFVSPASFNRLRLSGGDLRSGSPGAFPSRRLIRLLVEAGPVEILDRRLGDAVGGHHEGHDRLGPFRPRRADDGGGADAGRCTRCGRVGSALRGLAMRGDGGQ